MQYGNDVALLTLVTLYPPTWLSGSEICNFLGGNICTAIPTPSPLYFSLNCKPHTIPNMYDFTDSPSPINAMTPATIGTIMAYNLGKKYW